MATTTDWSEIDNHLVDHAWYSDSTYHEVFARLRSEDPLHWSDDTRYGHPYWFVTSYSYVRDMIEAPERFSNRMHNRLPRAPRRLTPEEKTAMGFDIGMASTDDPIHNLYRRPINKHFSVPGVAKLRSDVEVYVDDMIAEVADLPEFDIVPAMCAELPLRVVFRLLGIPTDDWDHLKLAANRWGTPADPRFMIDNDPVKTSLIGNKAIGEYCVALAEKRRQDPQDDFATVIGNLKIDGEQLSIHEMQVYFFTMITGGLENTRNAASAGVWAFLSHPDQRDRLVREPNLAMSAVEEVMRWVTPAKQILRVANDDMDYGGKRIHANDWVILSLASANKDERQFPEPHRFDIARTPNEHLSLGTGIHTCLGRALVRLELSIFFQKLFEAYPDLEAVDDGEPDWIPDIQSCGLASLPVRTNRRTAAA